MHVYIPLHDRNIYKNNVNKLVQNEVIMCPIRLAVHDLSSR
jgi:hypothetical protein